MRVLAHPDDFLPMFTQLKKNPKQNKAMLEAIDNVKQQLENSNIPLGAHHKKGSFPIYKARYNLQSLYHFDMPHYHRLMYTVRKGSSVGKEAVFLELLAHDEYNKLFGYFKKRSH